MGCFLADPGFLRPRHRVVAELLEKFDPDFLRREGIGFGGGTRIALELDEYRESIDIDSSLHTGAIDIKMRPT